MQRQTSALKLVCNEQMKEISTKKTKKLTLIVQTVWHLKVVKFRIKEVLTSFGIIKQPEYPIYIVN